jgi:hypothetical protein
MKNTYYISMGPILSSFFTAMGISTVERYPNELFPGHCGTLKWPPRSPVLSPLYYHLRDYTTISVRTQEISYVSEGFMPQDKLTVLQFLIKLTGLW